MMHRYPVPPSANRYWRHYRGRVVASDEAQRYKQTVKRKQNDNKARFYVSLEGRILDVDARTLVGIDTATEADLDKFVGQMAAMAYKGFRDYGPGGIVHWNEAGNHKGRMRFATLAEIKKLVSLGPAIEQYLPDLHAGDAFLLLIMEPAHTLAVAYPGEPLVDLYEQWGTTLAPDES